MGRIRNHLLGASASFYFPGCLFISSVVYLLISQETSRSDFTMLVLYYSVLFTIYLVLLKFFKNHFRTLLSFAVIYRLLVVLAVPWLSDDVYRFMWDGILILERINPYLHYPAVLLSEHHQSLSSPELMKYLFERMNSPDYYSVYPPVSQLLFAICAFFSHNAEGFTALFKGLIFTFEIGNLILILKILQHFNIAKSNVLIYALNPLVILELSGNAHFEGIMLFFLLFGIYFFSKKKIIYSGIFFAVSVLVKLIPLILIPFLFFRIHGRAKLKFIISFGIILALFTWPFLGTHAIAHFFTSINLYFQKFEFNASIYYLAKWVGFMISGFNQINVIGPALGIVSFLSIVCLIIVSLKKKVVQVPFYMGLALMSYYILSTTVHPWYLIPMLLLSVFIKGTASRPFRIGIIVWSFTVILSYHAYMQVPYREMAVLTAAQYIIFLSVIIMAILPRSMLPKLVSCQAYFSRAKP